MDALVAIAFGFFIILFVLPVVAVILLSAIDVLARKDIGVTKLIWLPLILMAPIGGMLFYWLLRPKDFDPWVDSERPTFAAIPVQENAHLREAA